MLEVGGGGITVCEVHLVQAPHYGLIVEPIDESDLQSEVHEFARFHKQAFEPLQEEEHDGSDQHGTTKEIERAIRNMSGLTRSKSTRSDGRVVRGGPGCQARRSIQRFRCSGSRHSGIDRTAERADLEEHFKDPNTIVVLCTSFNDAPSTSVQRLLERAKDAGVADLPTKVAVLALPRVNEALAMKDDDGFSAQTVEDGYELKHEQVDARLKALRVPGIPVGFFNALDDEPESLSRFLLRLVNKQREKHCDDLRDTITDAHRLVDNHDKEQTLEIQRQVAKRLAIWQKDNFCIDQFSKPAQNSLLAAIGNAHASSLRAWLRRRLHRDVRKRVDMVYCRSGERHGVPAASQALCQEAPTGLPV